MMYNIVISYNPWQIVQTYVLIYKHTLHIKFFSYICCFACFSKLAWGKCVVISVDVDCRRVPGWSWESRLYLWHCDTTFLCQFLFGFLTRIGVTQVRVEILVQDFRSLFAEVTSFSPLKWNKERFQYHWFKVDLKHLTFENCIKSI